MINQRENLRNILFSTLNSLSEINNFWQAELNKDPLLDQAFMTIELVFSNGKVVRMATDAVSISKLDGTVYNYVPWLQTEPQISTSYNIGSGRASQRTFSLTIDGRIIQAIDIVSSGNFIAGVGEISLQIQGGTYENRLVIMKGDMVGGLSFGAPDELVELELSDPIVSSDSIVPEYFITEEDYSTLPDDQLGQRIPLVFDQYSGGIPCIRTTNYEYGPTFVVCYGHNHIIDKVFVEGQEVPSYGQLRGWAYSNTYTGRSIPILLLDFEPPFPLEKWSENEAVYATVKHKDNENRSVLEIIRDVIIHYSGFGASGFDEALYSRSVSRSTYLNAELLINGSGSEDTTKAIEYCESTIGDNFPMISLAFSGSGIAPVFTDRRSLIVVANLTVGQGVLFDRITSVQESPTEQIFNSFTIKYSYNCVMDNYEKIITIDDTNNVLCAYSVSKLGKQEHEIIESVVIYDDATAQFVATWMADHMALPTYYVEYIGSPKLYFQLKLGDLIQITDSELNFTNVKGTVEKIIYSKGQVTIGVRLWLLFEYVNQ